jgi:hypothetical protein
MTLFKEFADIRMDAKEAGLVLPKLENDKPIIHEIKPHPAMKAYIESLNVRMKALKRNTKKGEDNALSLGGLARKATTDMRLISLEHGDRTDSKINEVVRSVVGIYKQTMDRKATQMVFLGEGRSYVGVEEDKVVSFDSYMDIRNKLIKAGVPAAEVVFAEKYSNDVQKAKLYEDMNSGKIRIIIGSYAKMGTGLNIQERLYAIHELDVPPRPSDIEQSEGRMIRQGNKHVDWDIPVQIHRYVVSGDGSYDAFMWQMQEAKLKGQRTFYKGGVREMDVGDDDLAVIRQLMALATNDPLVMRQAKLMQELLELEGQRKSYHTTKGESLNWLSRYRETTARFEQLLSENMQDSKFIILSKTDTNLFCNLRKTVFIESMFRNLRMVYSRQSIMCFPIFPAR